jgi:outer membrane biogenesis lipoprotein LolB
VFCLAAFQFSLNLSSPLSSRAVYLTHREQGRQPASSCPISNRQGASAEGLLIELEPPSPERG